MARITFGERLANMTYEELSQLDESEMKDALKKARCAYNRRVSQFARQGITSQAQVAFDIDRGALKRTAGGQLTRSQISSKPVSSLTRNQAYLELAKFKSFFEARTSTVSGARAVNREQDIRIFGGRKIGGRTVPLNSMSEYERQRFWAAYDEFYSSDATRAYTAALSSETIQQAIGTMISMDRIYTEDTDRVRYLEDVLDIAKSIESAAEENFEAPNQKILEGESSDELQTE